MGYEGVPGRPQCGSHRGPHAGVVVLVPVLATLLLCEGALGLKDVFLQTPTAVKAGSTVTLRCNYDLEKDSLYTVKWYKGLKEFFRFTPKELPSTQVFAFNNISVDVHNSDRNQVVLNSVQVSLSGKYRCEVSADAPSFQTLLAWGTLRVVDPPQEGLSLQVDKLRYSPSDRLRANCTVPPSLPPANVTWTVNGEPVPNHTVTTTPDNCTVDAVTALPRCGVLSQLDMEVQGSSFHVGMLRVQCRAHVWSLYLSAIHRDVYEEKPRLGASVLGNRDSSGSSRSCQWRWRLLSVSALLLLCAHHR